MAKVTIKGFKNIEEKVKRAFAATLSDANFLGDIADTVVKNNKANGRLGRDADGKKWSEPIAKPTVRQRDRMSTYNQTADTYSRARNNLTFTGQLIDSLNSKIDTAKRSISLFFNPTRSPYKNQDGTSQKLSVDNSQLYDIHKVKRPFLGVGKKLAEQIKNKVKAQLRRNIRRF